MVAGGPDFEFMNVWLLNRPEEDNPTAPTYREQFDSLARMILGERDAPNLELDNFLHITASAASGEQRLFDFKQLQWHPLLFPSTAKPKLVYNVFSYLGLEETLSWKKDFRQMIQRDVEVRDTVLGVDVDYFSHVYNLKGPQYYVENALGAFLFSANAILDTSYYIGKAFKEYMKDKENLKEPMTQEQIFDMLISFFPHVLIDVYDFLVKKGISIEKISEDLCYF
ncbi:hypothetical protein PRUPE_2G254700 [Prunus persica]|nr:hypothetical protein PRUPE_2G254700 [Prunus persica]